MRGMYEASCFCVFLLLRVCLFLPVFVVACAFVFCGGGFFGPAEWLNPVFFRFRGGASRICL